MNIPLTSKTYEWETPSDLFHELDKEFNFTLDPCASSENAKCKKFYTIQENGLSKDWSGNRVFVNPPFGNQISKWVRKSFDEAENCVVVMLIPARTDTTWWHEYVIKGEVRFIKGRIKFGGAKYNAPFPSAIVIF